MSGAALTRRRHLETSPTPGVNLVGFLEGHLGLGEVARKLERALERAGVPFVPIPYRRTPNARIESRRQVPDEAPYDVNLICLNADYLHTFAADVGADFFARRYSIGVWFWETSVFRQQDREGFRFLDEVWVASEYVRQSTAGDAQVPVTVVPLPFSPPPAPARSRDDLRLPDRFTFLFNFDFVSVERKNPSAVAAAFTSAFRNEEGPVLVLKGINGERKPERVAELEKVVASRDDVISLDTFLPDEEKNALVAACDCYVSLHRSEGFGLTIAEAISYGKPAIATGYSGNLEFMTEDNSYLVPYELTEIPHDWWAYAPGARWAEPDVEAAAELMRHVWENPEEARARGRRARDELLARFTLERAGSFVSGRLEAVLRDGALAPRLSPHDARPSIVDASLRLAEGTGAPLARAAGARPTSYVRRLLLRALWPYLQDEERLLRSLLDGLTTLQRSVDDLERRIADLEETSRAERPRDRS